MEAWIIRLIIGISYGGFLFIMSSGFTLALGIMKITNIAHGAIYLLSAYVGFTVWQFTGNFFVVILASSLLAAVIGIIMQTLLLRKVHKNPLAQMLLTMGVSLIITEVCMMFWGGYPRVMGLPKMLAGSTIIGSNSVPTYRLFIIFVAAIVGIILWFLIEKTKFGALIRACVDNEDMAKALGIKVPKLYLLVFSFTCFLGGLGGAIGAPFLGAYQEAQFEILTLALVIVVVGGLGSLRGALTASLLIGILDSFGKSIFPEFAHFTLFVPLFIVLSMKPTGLMRR